MWPSYRNFIVERVINECESAKSFFLVPQDGGAIAPFQPGQHLPLRLTVPGQAAPVYRFYTISDFGSDSAYRLTIKKELAPPHLNGVPHGIGSSHFHDDLRVGDVVEAKAPAGSFVVDLSKNHPVTFIAGGIGVTPLVSMMNAIARDQPSREIAFFYAVRNGGDHAFKDQLKELAGRLPGMRLRTAYSRPRAQDQLGVDYDVAGRFDLLALCDGMKSPDREYFVCGPTAMMDAIVNGLKTAGVTDSKIRTESFGPASRPTGSMPPLEPEKVAAKPSQLTVTFAKSGRAIDWNPAAPSLWHFAEENGIDISSGCLYGDCATCQTRLIDGAVTYLHKTAAKADPGTCLPCSCKPASAISLDA